MHLLYNYLYIFCFRFSHFNVTLFTLQKKFVCFFFCFFLNIRNEPFSGDRRFIYSPFIFTVRQLHVVIRKRVMIEMPTRFLIYGSFFFFFEGLTRFCIFFYFKFDLLRGTK